MVQRKQQEDNRGPREGVKGQRWYKEVERRDEREKDGNI